MMIRRMTVTANRMICRLASCLRRLLQRNPIWTRPIFAFNCASVTRVHAKCTNKKKTCKKMPVICNHSLLRTSPQDTMAESTDTVIVDATLAQKKHVVASATTSESCACSKKGCNKQPNHLVPLSTAQFQSMIAKPGYKRRLKK